MSAFSLDIQRRLKALKGLRHDACIPLHQVCEITFGISQLYDKYVTLLNPRKTVDSYLYFL